MIVQPTEEQVIIESDGKRLVGMFHPPGDTSPPRVAFVFCHPFAEEKKSSHRALVELARKLAAHGFGALRFDLFGCGDSEGDLGEATISGWLKDIQCARDFMAEALPGRPTGLLGLRLGATLAAISAADDATIEDLVLIEPIIEGKTYFASDLRRMLIKQMMTEGAAKTRRKDVLQSLEKGEASLDFDGFEISGRLYSEIAGLNLRKVKKAAGRVLVVQISPRRTLRAELEQIVADCRNAGANADARPLVMPPIWNLLDEIDSTPLADVVVAWAGRE